MSSQKMDGMASPAFWRSQQPQPHPGVENHENRKRQAGAKGSGNIAIDPHRRAMGEDHGDDMAEDDHRGLAQPDDPHRLAMVEESRGHVIVGKAEEVGAAAKDAAELIEQACRFDRYPAALRAIEELLALQLEAGVKHLQRTQQEGHSQGQRMLPILAAQKAAKRQLHQALVLLHGDEQAATRFAVGIKSLCSNYSEEIELCIRVLAAVETFLVRAGTWFAAQAMDQCLDSSTVAALVTFSAAGSQANAARGLLQDALQYWE